MKVIYAGLLVLVLGVGCGKKDFNSLKALAEKGDAEAQYEIGMMYRKGEGVEADLKEAFKWTRKAAEQDQPLAQYELGWMYDYGEGVEKDIVMAYVWFYIAPDVQSKIVRGLAQRMNPEQIAAAKAMVKDWQQKFKANKKKE